jgi:hypothetical protein
MDWEFESGRAAYRIGRPMPPRPDDDDDKSPVFFHWAGYMLERAKKLKECFMIEQALTDPDDFDPRPRKAA